MLNKLLKWLREHSYGTYWLIFILMILSSVLLYSTAARGATFWSWVLIGVVMFANMLVLFLR